MKYKKQKLDGFINWMLERHSIYLKRKAGKPWPWTKDKILKEYKFTNVFRQLDRVTQEWTQRYIHLMGRKKLKEGDLLFQLCVFRLFNWPETYDALFYNMATWNIKTAMKILEDRQKQKLQIFTGAYIIPNAGREDPKIQVICEALDFLWPLRHKYAKRIRKKRKMEFAVKQLQKVPTIGPFIAYEIACDLRHTRILGDAVDKISYANPGPGAKRGIHRILTGKKKWKGEPPDYVAIMYDLWKITKRRSKMLFKQEFPFEAREIEHSLCEFDKYERVKNKEGRPRSRYKPPETKDETGSVHTNKRKAKSRNRKGASTRNSKADVPRRKTRRVRSVQRPRPQEPDQAGQGGGGTVANPPVDSGQLGAQAGSAA